MRWLAILPSIFSAAVSVALIVVLWKPSEVQQIFSFSYIRFGVLAALALVAAYFVLSVRSEALNRFNNAAIFIAAATLILVEITFRVFPSLVPNAWLQLLPATAREELAAARGFLTQSNMRGGGLLFRRKAGMRVRTDKTNVFIDRDGFRNPATLGKTVDLVIVGASVFDGTYTKKNLGDLFRSNGIAAYAMATPAWGPGQYRDAFKKLIVGHNIKAGAVIFHVVIPRDIAKMAHYIQTRDTGGDWRDYLGRPRLMKMPFADKYYPWTLSILNGLPFRILYSGSKKIPGPNIQNKPMTVKLPWGVFTIPRESFKVPRTQRNLADYKTVLKDMMVIAKAAGTKPIFLQTPSMQAALAPYVVEGKKAGAAFANYHASVTAQIRSVIEAGGGEFIDTTDLFSKELVRAPLTGSILDVHLNEQGLQSLFGWLEPRLREILGLGDAKDRP